MIKYFVSFSLVTSSILCTAQNQERLKIVVGMNLFNPWADASLVYPLYKGTVSLSPTYGCEYHFNKSFALELRQHHFVSIAPNITAGSDITTYRRSTIIGGQYTFRNGLRLGLGLASYYLSDRLTSFGVNPHWDWGVTESISVPFENISIELRHEPWYRTRFILEGDKYSLNLTYRFKSKHAEPGDSLHKTSHLKFLVGLRIGLNRHYKDSKLEYNFLNTFGEWGLTYNIPRTRIGIEFRNAVWYSIGTSFSSHSFNGRSSLISLGTCYDVTDNGLITVGAEHFWLTDYTYDLIFQYDKIDFYPERGVGIYLRTRLKRNLILELRDQYAYHIHPQLRNQVEKTDIYRVSLGIYYVFDLK